MSQELIYTSAPRGLKPGSHGFCTVVSTQGISANLVQRLEAISGYRHVYAPQDANAALNPVNYSHLLLNIAGRRSDVLSRVCDAGLDHTQRTNKFAHHVVLDPRELAPGGPGWVLAAPGFMQSTWDGEPKILPAGRQPPLGNPAPGICRAWEQITGDAGWGGALAETASPGATRPAVIIFRAGVDPLPLLIESLALLPPARRWDVSFSTYFNKLPPGIDCQWRCVLEGSPEAIAQSRTRGALVIDLTAPQGPPPDSPLVLAARTGVAPVASGPLRTTVPGAERLDDAALDRFLSESAAPTQTSSPASQGLQPTAIAAPPIATVPAGLYDPGEDLIGSPPQLGEQPFARKPKSRWPLVGISTAIAVIIIPLGVVGAYLATNKSKLPEKAKTSPADIDNPAKPPETPSIADKTAIDRTKKAQNEARHHAEQAERLLRMVNKFKTDVAQLETEVNVATGNVSSAVQDVENAASKYDAAKAKEYASIVYNKAKAARKAASDAAAKSMEVEAEISKAGDYASEEVKNIANDAKNRLEAIRPLVVAIEHASQKVETLCETTITEANKLEADKKTLESASVKVVDLPKCAELGELPIVSGLKMAPKDYGIDLIGRKKIFPDGYVFSITPIKGADADRWSCKLERTSKIAGDVDPKPEIAQFFFRGEVLFFKWTSKARTSAPSGLMRNCLLEIELLPLKEKARICLRKAVKAPGLKFPDLAQLENTCWLNRIPVESVPTNMVRFELLNDQADSKTTCKITPPDKDTQNDWLVEIGDKMPLFFSVRGPSGTSDKQQADNGDCEVKVQYLGVKKKDIPGYESLLNMPSKQRTNDGKVPVNENDIVLVNGNMLKARFANYVNKLSKEHNKAVTDLKTRFERAPKPDQQTFLQLTKEYNDALTEENRTFSSNVKNTNVIKEKLNPWLDLFKQYEKKLKSIQLQYRVHIVIEGKEVVLCKTEISERQPTAPKK